MWWSSAAEQGKNNTKPTVIKIYILCHSLALPWECTQGLCLCRAIDCREQHPMEHHHHPALISATLTSSFGPLCTISHTSPHIYINCFAFGCTSCFYHSWSLVLLGHVLNRKLDTMPTYDISCSAGNFSHYLLVPGCSWLVHLPFLSPMQHAKCASVCPPRIKLHCFWRAG